MNIDTINKINTSIDDVRKIDNISSIILDLDAVVVNNISFYEYMSINKTIDSLYELVSLYLKDYLSTIEHESVTWKYVSLYRCNTKFLINKYDISTFKAEDYDNLYDVYNSRIVMEDELSTEIKKGYINKIMNMMSGINNIVYKLQVNLNTNGTIEYDSLDDFI